MLAGGVASIEMVEEERAGDLGVELIVGVVHEPVDLGLGSEGGGASGGGEALRFGGPVGRDGVVDVPLTLGVAGVEVVPGLDGPASRLPVAHAGSEANVRTVVLVGEGKADLGELVA